MKEITEYGSRKGVDLRKVLVVIAAVCMMFTLVPMVDADDTTDLQTAIDNTTENGTLDLNSNYSITSPIVINKAITINGANHSVTGSNGINVFNITAGGVTLNNLTITASGNGIAVNCSANDLTVNDCIINAAARGINFYTTATSGASLTVTGTTITNTLADSTYGVYYNTDNRGIATGDVKNGDVEISNCNIFGFKYGINAVISPDYDNGGLRDGVGTVFDVSGTTVYGWAALNMWSANTTFNFTDCNLYGVNNLGGGSNDYATIMANDDMYAGSETLTSTVNIYGGSLTAIRYSVSLQTAVYVDTDGRTDYNFYTNESGDKVQIYAYGTAGYPASAFMFQDEASFNTDQYITNTGFYTYAEYYTSTIVDPGSN